MGQSLYSKSSYLSYFCSQQRDPKVCMLYLLCVWYIARFESICTMFDTFDLFHVLFALSIVKDMPVTNRPNGKHCGTQPRIRFSQVHPDLLNTVRRIHAKRILVATKKEEMLGNFKLSTRGSIRRAPNVMPGTYHSVETVSMVTHTHTHMQG